MKFPPLTMSTARVIAGAGVFVLTLLILAIMVFVPELAKDDLFKMIAQAIIIQGLIGLVMAFLFTFLFTGKNGNDQDSGKTVTIDQPADEPIPTKETK